MAQLSRGRDASFWGLERCIDVLQRQTRGEDTRLQVAVMARRCKEFLLLERDRRQWFCINLLQNR